MRQCESRSGRDQAVLRNKDKLIGAKPPLRQKHGWSIHTKVQIEGKTRDLALFNLAIDSKFLAY